MVFQLCQPRGRAVVYNKWCPAPLRACMGRPKENGCKERCGAGSCSTILKSSVWAAGNTTVAPTPLRDDGVLTCCLYAEGVSCSTWGRSPPRLHLPCQGKIHRSAHTLLVVTAALHAQPSPSFLQQKALFTPTTPIWPPAINLWASNCSTLCDNSVC